MLLSCLLEAELVSAQGVIWELEPRDCSSLASIGYNMYSISEGANMGVIDSRGNVIVPLEHSQVTPFREGIALVLSGDKIDGTLTSAGAFRQFDVPYYVLDGQEFFSDGFITVRNQRGEKGFIDMEGNPLGFNKGYTNIKPFTEGHSAVKVGTQFMLVDKALTPVPITIGIGVVTGGTNFYQGNAIVWDGKGNAYEVTTKQTARKKEYDIERLQNRQLDYLGRLSSITGQDKTVVYDADAKGKPQFEPYQNEGGRWGYKGLVLCQFSAAEPIYDNLGVVKRMGRWGIIRVNENDMPFSVKAEKTNYVYREDEQVNCKLQLVSTPSVWQGKDVSIRIVEKKGQNTVGHGKFQNEMFSFDVKPSEPTETYTYNIIAGGLLMQQGELTYNFEKLVPFTANVQIKNTKADDKDHCHVHVTVRNPNSVPITATITVSGSGSLNNVSQKKTVAAKAVVELDTWFSVPQNALYNQMVLVKMDGKVICEKTIAKLEPFYTAIP